MTNLPETRCTELELDNGWLTIWFNQPEMRNPLTEEMRNDLMETLAAIRDDREVRGVTLRGRGGVFCAGGDLKMFRAHFQGEASREDIVAMSRDAAAIMDAVNTAPQVVMSLIEGAAVAGGFGLACCSDVVICQTSAKFSMTETMIGLSPAQIAPFVIQKLGYSVARRLMLTAERFDGARALELGFADFVGETVADLESVETKIRSQVLKCAPGAVAATKDLVRILPDLARADAVDAAAENFADRMVSDEAREGIASFLEKRPARWAPETKTS
ncbi:MAG: enoyl-CoA hydratase-related protein [Pseudomonadota bacterium]